MFSHLKKLIEKSHNEEFDVHGLIMDFMLSILVSFLKEEWKEGGIVKHAGHQKGSCRGQVESAWTVDDNRSTWLKDSLADGGQGVGVIMAHPTESYYLKTVLG